MESIDDPVTDSQKPSTYSTNSPNITARPPRTRSLVTGRRHHEQLQSTRASRSHRGLIIQPQTWGPGRDCLRDSLKDGALRTGDQHVAVNRLQHPVTGSSGPVAASSAVCRGVKLSCPLSLLSLPALTSAAPLMPRRIGLTVVP
ncbi:chemokine-like protein TAFA-5a isoform X1 [Halichoeres trimaculatus]|uniref:chemokine-like protein TAFA-5a isoform X1 n=1 Tax=Halichoeres trimaculatus TaxID=147232 RepID=UPI003D9F8688